MNISKTILSGFAAAGLLSASIMPVAAADVSPVNKVFSPTRAFTWSGVYAGVNAGYAFGDADSFLAVGGATNPLSSKYDGFIGGVQLGYNWQTGPAVFGVEVEMNYADVSGTALIPTTTVTTTNKLEWFGAARGRIGYAFDRVMPYVAGGFAFGKNKLEVNDLANNVRISDTATHVGWTLGGGVEMAVRENWSARVEYLHVDLGNKSSYLAGIIGGPGSYMNADLKFDLVRAGLNYRF
ncbi:MAG TPA: outer membrane protein [Pseudolabrys sp.]|nr:outer membrane protein [Pseudolabrys sp.]